MKTAAWVAGDVDVEGPASFDCAVAAVAIVLASDVKGVVCAEEARCPHKDTTVMTLAATFLASLSRHGE